MIILIFTSSAPRNWTIYEFLVVLKTSSTKPLCQMQEEEVVARCNVVTIWRVINKFQQLFQVVFLVEATVWERALSWWRNTRLGLGNSTILIPFLYQKTVSIIFWFEYGDKLNLNVATRLLFRYYVDLRFIISDLFPVTDSSVWALLSLIILPAIWHAIFKVFTALSDLSFTRYCGSIYWHNSRWIPSSEVFLEIKIKSQRALNYWHEKQLSWTLRLASTMKQNQGRINH